MGSPAVGWKTPGVWKHEEPLEPEPEATPVVFHVFGSPKREPSQPESMEQRATREREREASRPFHQFVYQVSKERERMQDQRRRADIVSDPVDISTHAYEVVKDTWTERGVWNTKWGVLPGMSWKHEQPLQDKVREEMGDVTPPFQGVPGFSSPQTEGEPSRNVVRFTVPDEPRQASRETSPSQSLFGWAGSTQMPNEASPGQQRFGGAATISPPKEASPGRNIFGKSSSSQAPRDAPPGQGLFAETSLSQEPGEAPLRQNIFGRAEPDQAPEGAPPRQELFATAVEYQTSKGAAPGSSPTRAVFLSGDWRVTSGDVERLFGHLPPKEPSEASRGASPYLNFPSEPLHQPNHHTITPLVPRARLDGSHRHPWTLRYH